MSCRYIHHAHGESRIQTTHQLIFVSVTKPIPFPFSFRKILNFPRKKLNIKNVLPFHRSFTKMEPFCHSKDFQRCYMTHFSNGNVFIRFNFRVRLVVTIHIAGILEVDRKGGSAYTDYSAFPGICTVQTQKCLCLVISSFGQILVFIVSVKYFNIVVQHLRSTVNVL